MNIKELSETLPHSFEEINIIVKMLEVRGLKEQEIIKFIKNVAAIALSTGGSLFTITMDLKDHIKIK